MVLLLIILLSLPVTAAPSDMAPLVTWARGQVAGMANLRHTTADGATYAVDRVRVDAVGDEIVIRIRPRRVGPPSLGKM